MMALNVHSGASHIPLRASQRLLELESLIYDTAKKEGLGKIEKSIKWGQASFHCKTGTPMRLGWDSRSPDSCFIYFHCQTRVIACLKEVFAHELIFHGNRAIELPLSQPLALPLIRKCIEIGLTYRNIRHEPSLGL